MNIAKRLEVPINGRLEGMSFQQADELYRALGRELHNPASIKGLIAKSAEFFGCTVEELLCPCRDTYNSERRWHVMRYLREYERMSLTQIGRNMPKKGNPRDHGTIIHGIERHRELADAYRTYRATWRAFVGHMQAEGGER